MLDQCLDLKFNSIDQRVCFYANTMKVLLLMICIVQLEIKDGETSGSSFVVQGCF